MGGDAGRESSADSELTWQEELRLRAEELRVDEAELSLKRRQKDLEAEVGWNNLGRLVIAMLVGLCLGTFIMMASGYQVYHERQYETFQWKTRICVEQGKPYMECFGVRVTNPN